MVSTFLTPTAPLASSALLLGAHARGLRAHCGDGAQEHLFEAAAAREARHVLLEDDPSLVDDHDLLADLRDLGENVRREDHRTLPGKLTNQGTDLDDLPR